MERIENPEWSTLNDLVVVAYLLKKAQEKGKGLTPLQVNKLVYICHGWALGMLNRPLIDNSRGQIQAWKYGPVVEKVYSHLKHWGRKEITYTSFCNHFGKDIENFLSEKINQLKKNDPKICALLDVVWYVYQDVSGGQLITATHQEGTPWDTSVKRNWLGQVVREVPIPDDTISGYYTEQLSSLVQSGILSKFE